MGKFFGQISPADWLAASVSFFGVLVAIGLAIWLGPWLSRKQDQTGKQEELFRRLLNGWQLPAHPDWQTSIALIPVDFKGCKPVLLARREYLNLANSEKPNNPEEEMKIFENFTTAQLNLLEQIAKFLKIDDLDGVALRKEKYVAQGFIDRDMMYLNALMSWPKIAHELKRSNDIVQGIREDR